MGREGMAMTGFVESVVVGEEVLDRLWVASEGLRERTVEAVPVPMEEGEDALRGGWPDVLVDLNPSRLFMAATVLSGLGANDDWLDLGEIETVFGGGDSSPKVVTPDAGLPIALPSFGL
jgi:hypothetical protein